MASRKGPEDLDVTLKFGGGIHSRASEDEIDPRECHSGQNFDLDAQNTEFRNREPIDLVGTAPNAGQINGFVTLQKVDGTVTFLVQAGDTVYDWDGASTFTSKGTVNASAQLRGSLQQNWQLGDKVIITDLSLNEPVMEWDGTTLSYTTFTKNNGAGAFGTFKSKYCIISNERAMYANVVSNGTETPHILVGSLRGDYSDISVDNRPSSSLSAADPWFIIQPDFRVINGLAQSFGVVVTSSHHGSLFNLTGSDATDFAFSELYPRSGADGVESLTYAGNDILYGRQGRIESVLSTNKFGNVESDDLSNDIGNLVENFKGWTLVYNARNQRVYCMPESQSEVWVFHKSIYERFKQIEQGTDATTAKGLDISPWVKWTTAAGHSMQFTAMMNMLDPADKLEYVFAGDASGNIYRLEGTGTSGDSATSNINTERLSNLIQMPLDTESYNIEGWIQYRKNEAATVTLKFEYAGMNVFNETITITIPAVTGRPVFGGSLYFNDSNYYGTAFSNRLTRQKFGVPGKSNAFQVRATVDGTTNFQINSIGLRFSAGS